MCLPMATKGGNNGTKIEKENVYKGREREREESLPMRLISRENRHAEMLAALEVGNPSHQGKRNTLLASLPLSATMTLRM